MLISSFQISSSQGERREPEFARKKKMFRDQRRKQYLNEYFSKKRVDYFGWSHQLYINSNKQTNEIYQDVQIDKQNSVLSQQFMYGDLSPKYNEKYFQNINLLERFIAQNQQVQLDNEQLEHSYNFRYKSLYEFTIDVIRESLNKVFFTELEDQQIFINHFTTLKDFLYKKLGEQIEAFLVGFYDTGSEYSQDNLISSDILLENYRKLLAQLENFIFIQNLETEQCKEWPLITIEEQLSFLIKVFISITYFDPPKQAENIIEKMTSKISKVQEKYKEIFKIDEDHYEQKIPSATQYLVSETILLQRLKFLIVFGHLQINESNNEDKQTEKKRKYREIRLIIHLLKNIAYNIGCDVLFESEIIKQLEFILTEPQFKVNIGQKRRNNLNETYIPELHMRIHSFIIDIFQTINSQKSLEYLSQIDSLQFTFDTLQKVTQIKKRIENSLETGPICLNRQVMLIDFKVQDDTTNIDESEEDQKLSNHKRRNIYALAQMAQQCIQCIEFHLVLGQILHQNQFQNQQIQTENRYIFKLRYLIMLSQENILEGYHIGRDLLKKWKITQNY